MKEVLTSDGIAVRIWPSIARPSPRLFVSNQSVPIGFTSEEAEAQRALLPPTGRGFDFLTRNVFLVTFFQPSHLLDFALRENVLAARLCRGSEPYDAAGVLGNLFYDLNGAEAD